MVSGCEFGFAQIPWLMYSLCAMKKIIIPSQRKHFLLALQDWGVVIKEYFDSVWLKICMELVCFVFFSFFYLTLHFFVNASQLPSEGNEVTS